MNIYNSKEYFDILDHVKNIINNSNFTVSEIHFKKEYLKKMLKESTEINNIMSLLKERNKNHYNKNHNALYLLKNYNKKHLKESKIIITNTLSFSIFYNEPQHISQLNESLYRKILDKIIDFSKSFCGKLIIASNGNNNGNSLEMQEGKIDSDGNQDIIKLQNILYDIYRCRNENLNIGNELFKIKLATYDIMTIKQTYENLIFSIKNIDEEIQNGKKRREIIETLIKENKKNHLIEILKKGIPNELRKVIYLFLMNVDLNSLQETATITISDDYSLILDYFVMEDVKIPAFNENYFLFEENLKKILLRLIREKDLITEVQGIRPLILISSNNKENNYYCPFPMSGFIPFPGLASQMACFCYISTNPSEIYPLIKNFFCKYISYLSSFSTDKNSALSLIYNFNSLFQTLFKDLYTHFSTLHYDANLIFFQWLSTCFSNLIPPQGVFILYDITILTESLLIFVLFGLSIFLHKKQNLLNFNTLEEIKHCLDFVQYESIDTAELLFKLINFI